MQAADEESQPLWRNWSREQVCRPQAIVRPRTREGLVMAILEAAEAGRRIRVAGSGHSFTGAALSDGTLLRIEALDRLLDFDPASGLIRVEAGAVLGELNRRLDGLGRAFENLGDIDKQTLAGSISTGTHGTGIRFQNLSAQVEAIELIGADGTSVELSER
jgi:FAD/FMN-containing dehydrogenase